MQCGFGMAPSSLVVLPTNKVMTNMVPDANIMDHIPMTNIMPFAMCQSTAKPTVAAATAAALGVSHADALHSEHNGSLGGWSTDGVAG